MSIGEQVKAAATGPGRKWVLVGGAAGLGYLWWTRGRSRAATGNATAAFTPGGAAVADPLVPPGGDFSEPASTLPAQRPANNAEWLQEATAKLILPPHNHDAIAVFNSLTKALAGDPITTAEATIVQGALTVAGTPPEGMPRLNVSSPSNPQANTPPPSSPSSPTPTVQRTVKSGDTLGGIASGWGVTTSAAYARNAAAIEAAAKAHGRSSSRGGPNNSLGWWIFPGTVLVKP